jgi:hypothetical protein
MAGTCARMRTINLLIPVSLRELEGNRHQIARSRLADGIDPSIQKRVLGICSYAK